MSFDRLHWYNVSIRDADTVIARDVTTTLAFLADEDGWVSRKDFIGYYPNEPGVAEFFDGAERMQLVLPEGGT